MKRSMFVFVVLIVLCSVGIAQESGKDATGIVSSWLKDLQKKIEQIIPKKTPPVTTSVAGVRGAKEEAQAKLYWKGKKGDEAITEEELSKFKAAVDTALAGDNSQAAKMLEEFMQQYPDSALIPDAKKTLDLVKTRPIQ